MAEFKGFKTISGASSQRCSTSIAVFDLQSMIHHYCSIVTWSLGGIVELWASHDAPLSPLWRHSQNRKYITYHHAVRGGLDSGTKNLVKFCHVICEIREQRDKQTCSLLYIAFLLGWSEKILNSWPQYRRRRSRQSHRPLQTPPLPPAHNITGSESSFSNFLYRWLHGSGRTSVSDGQTPCPMLDLQLMGDHYCG